MKKATKSSSLRPREERSTDWSSAVASTNFLNNASLAKKAEERSDAENEYITKFAELTKAQEGFHISAARLMSDVEDLTEENIDSWVPKF